MWRSISSTSPLTRNLGKRLFSLQNQSSSSFQSQVFHHKCFTSSSYCTYLLNRANPRKFTYQNLRFLSQSSLISEFESENHSPNSSSSEGEVDNDAIDVIDENGEINGAQISRSSAIDELPADFDGNVENDDAQIEGFGLTEGLDADFGENVENNDVEKLEKLLSLLQSTVEESLETSLDDLELNLNDEFMVRVIETPLVPGAHLVRFFKWALSKEGSEVTTSKVLGSLANVICNAPKRRDVYALWDLVKEVEESGVVSVELLNQLIHTFSELGKGKAAFEVFGKFDDLGCVPNVDTYYFTIKALCKRSFYEWSLSVSQKMLDAGMLPDSCKVGDIISFYCKGLKSKEAHAVYLAARQKNMYPSQRPVNFLVSCLSKDDETVSLAKEMLAEFSSQSRKQGINPFSWVIRGLCRKKDVEGGKKLLLEMIEKGPPPGNAVFNTVINALSKAGDVEEAKEMLKLMETRGLKPDVFSYSVIISGYTKGGLMEEACKVLSDARKKHPKLCPVTIHTLIRGYCKLEQFDKAVNLLKDMRKYGVEPNVDEYNKLIQSLCLKALDWKTAERLLEEMKANGMHLPSITRDLISAVKELEQEAAGPEEAVMKA
ncbi:uncharacterized protein LOC141605843 [Silene latifolia]|uniref:uncharacterized protein LOC141605843 n=1 Tax=Silene latifolia TaxID=37657 RepID=UPI003D7711E1